VDESLLAVIVPAHAAPTEAIVAHGMVNVSALHVTTAKAGGGRSLVRICSPGITSRVLRVSQRRDVLTCTLSQLTTISAHLLATSLMGSISGSMPPIPTRTF
jgi:hypothetical protein